MSRRFVVVTACDETYLPLALDLLRSLRRLQLPFAFDIGILDLGLSEAGKAALAPFGATLAKPKADIDYPDREAWEKQAPFYRAMTSRPYLRDYFAGYDSYMWMDADTWAQTKDALATMLPASAEDDALYIASEFDRDYAPYFLSSKPWEYHLTWYKAHFPDDIVTKIFPRPMLNTGVLALSAASPVWEKWAETFTHCLQHLPQLGRENFMSEQLSLNVAMYINGLPLKVMPSEFNWMSLYTLPMINAATRDYIRPTVPRNILSVIHITHPKKLSELELLSTDNKRVRCKMTFTDYQRNKSVNAD